MSEIRQNIFAGDCVETQTEIFERLDQGDLALLSTAQRICQGCHLLDSCFEAAPERTQALAGHGIQETIVAAHNTNPPPPFTFTPFTEDPAENLEKIRQAFASGQPLGSIVLTSCPKQFADR